MKKQLTYITILIFLNSCAFKKDVIYFNNPVDIISKSTTYTPTLKIDDLLTISVMGGDEITMKLFNLPTPATIGQRSYTMGAPAQSGYLIDNNGEIEFPIIRKVKVDGLTRNEAIKILYEKISQYIKDPIIQLQIQNFKVTILGEVRNAGTFNIPNERITVLEAIGLAGDLTIYGKRKNILVLREENGAKKGYRIDLTNSDFLDSPVYYLNQNDVVYVEPNKSKITSSAVNPSIGVFISITSLIVTTINVLTK